MSDIPKEKIEEIDRLYFTPKERAEKVNAILQASKGDHTFIDITCFSVQWLAMLAVGSLSDDEDLVRIARLTNIWLHTRHYNDPKAIYGEPDREKKTDDISEFDLVDDAGEIK